MRKAQKIFVTRFVVFALLPAVAIAQPDQPNRLPSERLGEQPTVQERIVEEQVIAEKAAQEVAAELQAGEIPADDGELAEQATTANDGSPAPDTHATHPAPDELIALAAREPDRFLGKILVLTDGVKAVTVGPVLALRKRVLDQETYLVVDATAYFNAPTQYAIAVKDLDHLEADRLVMPEADGMHLRGLDYYPDDYADLESTAPETVLAEQAEGEEAAAEAEDAEPGVIPLSRF